MDDVVVERDDFGIVSPILSGTDRRRRASRKLFADDAGAVAGSGATKDTSKRYLIIVTTDGTIVIPFPPTLETQAQTFAARVNTWGR